MAEAPDSHQFITDISGRIIELAMGDDEGRVYIAYALAGVLDDLASVEPGAPEREFAEVLNMQILKTLTYAQLVRVASPEDIEGEVARGRAILDQMFGNNNNEEEPTNGNGDD